MAPGIGQPHPGWLRRRGCDGIQAIRTSLSATGPRLPSRPPSSAARIPGVSMSTPTMDPAAKVLADPTAYADDERLHAALTRLRATNPLPGWTFSRTARYGGAQ